MLGLGGYGVSRPPVTERLCGGPSGYECHKPVRASQVPAHQLAAEINAAQGIVTIQAMTMLPATPQRTAEARCAEPTPMIAPVIVCVVETGIPSVEARKRVSAPPVSAENPPTGLSLVIRWPIVLTMRQPPNRVPSAIAI